MFKLIIVSYLVFICGYNFFITEAAPIQNLPPKDGYVPVYIRIGDTPLNEIHPGLAEAFKEFDDHHSPQIIDEPKDNKENNEIKRQAILNNN